MTIKDHVKVLYRDGYHAAAKIIEGLQGSVSKPAELEYLRDFVRGGDFGEELYRNQLRSLWTAYCFHHDLTVDTGEYDNTVLGLWHLVQDAQRLWKDFDEFDGFLCEFLV